MNRVPNPQGGSCLANSLLYPPTHPPTHPPVRPFLPRTLGNFLFTRWVRLTAREAGIVSRLLQTSLKSSQVKSSAFVRVLISFRLIRAVAGPSPWRTIRPVCFLESVRNPLRTDALAMLSHSRNRFSPVTSSLSSRFSSSAIGSAMLNGIISSSHRLSIYRLPVHERVGPQSIISHPSLVSKR